MSPIKLKYQTNTTSKWSAYRVIRAFFLIIIVLRWIWLSPPYLRRGTDWLTSFVAGHSHSVGRELVSQRDLTATDSRFESGYEDLRRQSLEPEFELSQPEIRGYLTDLHRLHNEAESDYKACETRNEVSDIYEKCIGEWYAYDHSSVVQNRIDWWNQFAPRVRSQLPDGFAEVSQGLVMLTNDPVTASADYLDVVKLQHEFDRASELNSKVDDAVSPYAKDALIFDANDLLVDVMFRLYAYKPYRDANGIKLPSDSQ